MPVSQWTSSIVKCSNSCSASPVSEPQSKRAWSALDAYGAIWISQILTFFENFAKARMSCWSYFHCGAAGCCPVRQRMPRSGPFLGFQSSSSPDARVWINFRSAANNRSLSVCWETDCWLGCRTGAVTRSGTVNPLGGEGCCTPAGLSEGATVGSCVSCSDSAYSPSWPEKPSLGSPDWSLFLLLRLNVKPVKQRQAPHH